MEKRFCRICLAGLFCLAITGRSTAQISLAPAALYIDHKTGIGSLYVRNTGEGDLEVDLLFSFSYPGYDDRGNMVTVKNDTIAARQFSLIDHLFAFPRRFVLQPGRQQVIRLQVRSMHQKPDGMYWARVIVRSRAPAEDVEALMADEDIGTRIHYELRQNIPVFYRKGSVSTGLKVMSVETMQKEGKLIVMTWLRHSGNAPYSGTVVAALTGKRGEGIAGNTQTIVAYFDALRRCEIPLPEEQVTPGVYNLELLFQTKRPDISPAHLVQSEDLHYRMKVELK